MRRKTSRYAVICTRITDEERDAFNLAVAVEGMLPSELTRLATVEWLRANGWLPPAQAPFFCKPPIEQ
jgi:hypothetical protein